MRCTSYFGEVVSAISNDVVKGVDQAKKTKRLSMSLVVDSMYFKSCLSQPGSSNCTINMIYWLDGVLEETESGNFVYDLPLMETSDSIA